MITGLFVYVDSVTDHENSDMGPKDSANMIYRLLGKRPNLDEFKLGALFVIRLSWMHKNFKKLPVHADNEVLSQYVRARILTLLAIYLSDKNQMC